MGVVDARSFRGTRSVPGSRLRGVAWLLVVVLLLPAVGAYLALGVLTAIGQRRRRGGALLAAGAIVFFPVYWVAWYVRDSGPSAHRLARP